MSDFEDDWLFLRGKSPRTRPGPHKPSPYLGPESPDAFVDFPAPGPCPVGVPAALTALCPLCKGHGGWNLLLNQYPLHSHENTPENRHRYGHFRASCSQCNGWGWTSDLSCLHEYVWDRNVGHCLNTHRCLKCGHEQTHDSSD